jgi:hypothetical protein
MPRYEGFDCIEVAEPFDGIAIVRDELIGDSHRIGNPSSAPYSAHRCPACVLASWTNTPAAACLAVVGASAGCGGLVRYTRNSEHWRSGTQQVYRRDDRTTACLCPLKCFAHGCHVPVSITRCKSSVASSSMDLPIRASASATVLSPNHATISSRFTVLTSIFLLVRCRGGCDNVRPHRLGERFQPSPGAFGCGLAIRVPQRNRCGLSPWWTTQQAHSSASSNYRCTNAQLLRSWAVRQPVRQPGQFLGCLRLFVDGRRTALTCTRVRTRFA